MLHSCRGAGGVAGKGCENEKNGKLENVISLHNKINEVNKPLSYCTQVLLELLDSV